MLRIDEPDKLQIETWTVVAMDSRCYRPTPSEKVLQLASIPSGRDGKRRRGPGICRQQKRAALTGLERCRSCAAYGFGDRSDPSAVAHDGFQLRGVIRRGIGRGADLTGSKSPRGDLQRIDLPSEPP